MKTWTLAAVAAALLAAPLTAQAGTTPKAGAHWFAGAVTSAGSGSVSVDVLWTGKHDTQLNGTTVTVAIDSSTQIHYGKGRSSIAVGDLVGVVDAGGTAKRINVRCNCHFAAGTVSSTSTGSFALQVERSGPFDTVLKGNTVTFQLGGASAPTVGQKVAVRFSATGFFKDPSFNWQTATFTVEKIRARRS
jgi:hypothetical protein